MIENLRWVAKVSGVYSTNGILINVLSDKILQAYDGHKWFDVPVVQLPEQKGNE